MVKKGRREGRGEWEWRLNRKKGGGRVGEGEEGCGIFSPCENLGFGKKIVVQRNTVWVLLRNTVWVLLQNTVFCPNKGFWCTKTRCFAKKFSETRCFVRRPRQGVSENRSLRDFFWIRLLVSVSGFDILQEMPDYKMEAPLSSNPERLVLESSVFSKINASKNDVSQNHCDTMPPK